MLNRGSIGRHLISSCPKPAVVIIAGKGVPSGDGSAIERKVNARLIGGIDAGAGKESKAPNSSVNRDVSEDHKCGAKDISGENLQKRPGQECEI